MFISSTKGEETVKSVIAAPKSLQKAEFPRILNKQIANPVKPTPTAVSTQGFQIGNMTSIEPGRFFLSAISKHNPPVSNLFTKHPSYGKDCLDILFSKLDCHKPNLKMQDGSVTVETDKDKPVLNNGLQAAGKNLQEPELVQIGTLSKGAPTVSELLIKHPAYGKNCWNILNSSINRDKTYTTIPDGSRIYLNPETLEIVWNRQKVSGNGTQTKNNTPKNAEPVFLGTLSKSNPTVSELLIKHPAYGKDCWGILSSSINRDKTYTTIPGGSRIYLNPRPLKSCGTGAAALLSTLCRWTRPIYGPNRYSHANPILFPQGWLKLSNHTLGNPTKK